MRGDRREARRESKGKEERGGMREEEGMNRERKERGVRGEREEREEKTYGRHLGGWAGHGRPRGAILQVWLHGSRQLLKCVLVVNLTSSV